MKQLFFVAGAVVLAAILAHARPVKLWQPDELHEPVSLQGILMTVRR
jgi:hypothetical protein